VKLYDEPEFIGFRLSVRVYEGVHAYGILLVPTNIKPGERRPVVFASTVWAVSLRTLWSGDNQRADSVYSKFGRNSHPRLHRFAQ